MRFGTIFGLYFYLIVVFEKGIFSFIGDFPRHFGGQVRLYTRVFNHFRRFDRGTSMIPGVYSTFR